MEEEGMVLSSHSLVTKDGLWRMRPAASGGSDW